MNRTICIVGAGWLGRQVGSALLEDGWRVVATTTREAREAELAALGFEPMRYRIGESPLPDADALLVAASASACIPWLSTPPASAPRRLIHISTTSVYDGLHGALTTDAVVPGVPPEGSEQRFSPHSKVTIADLIRLEGLFHTLAPGRCLTLRCGGLVGPGREAGRLLAGRTGVRDPESGAAVSPADLITRHIREWLAADLPGAVRNAVLPGTGTRRAYYTAAARALDLPEPAFAPQTAPPRHILP